MEPENKFKDYIAIWKHYKTFIFIGTSVCVFIVLIVSILQLNVYRASTVLLVDTEPANILNVKDVVTLGDSNYWSYKEYLQTQIEILQGRPIIEEIYEKLNIKNRTEANRFLLINKKINGFFFVKKIRNFLNKTSAIFVQNSKEKNPSNEYYRSLKKLQKNISVTHMRDTRLIEIAYEDTDPCFAAEVVNSLAQIFVSKNLERKLQASKEARLWLVNEIEQLRKSLKEKEEYLQTFRRENNIFSPDESKAIINGVLLDLNQKLAQENALFAESKKKYQDPHPRMLQIQEKISQLETMIKEKREEAILFEEKMIQYNDLLSEVQLTRKLLENVLSREKETLIASNIHTNNISIASNAIPPEKPVKPKRKLNILISLIFGFFGSFALALFLHFMKKTVQTSADVIQHDVPFLGYVPAIKQSLFKKRDTVDAYLLFNTKGIISELFNNLRTSIIIRSDKKDETGKSMLITSFLPGEGKTLISSNLAIAMAKFHFKTLLIETDLRRPRIHKVFNMEQQNGLSTYLEGKAEITDVIQKGPLHNLDIIYAGGTPENPLALLGSKKFKDMISYLEQKYEIIFLDTPPVFSVTDAVFISTIVKRVVIVSKQNHTPKKMIPMILDRFKTQETKILGMIINYAKESVTTEISEYKNYSQNYYSLS